jgi:hypothetical protein
MRVGHPILDQVKQLIIDQETKIVKPVLGLFKKN